jgi:hypothetical protein
VYWVSVTSPEATGRLSRGTGLATSNITTYIEGAKNIEKRMREKTKKHEQ